MNNPDYMLPELAVMLPQWELVADCYAGERAIKAKSTAYLPDPSPAGEDDEVRKKRYADYITRAVFYNVVRNTAKGLSGLVFAKYPMVTLPNELEQLEKDIDGAGNSLVQHTKRALNMCLLKGRGGLLANYPTTETELSKAEVKELGLRSTVTLYEPESIINWRTETVRGLTKLTLVVIKESYVKSDDGFKAEMGEQLLVLRLTEGQATSQIYRKENGTWISQKINKIRNSAGQPFDEIPFTFFGADDNDATIDDAPLYDLSVLNIAHYRDSADYQEGNFIAGQPTLFISGVTEDWVNKVLSQEKYKVRLGSRSANILNQGANAQLLQATTNNANFEAMQHKERQMVGLGAKLLDTSLVPKTATEANGNIAEQTSALATIANNISDAYSKALTWCAEFEGVAGDCIVTLNTRYNTNKMTPQERQQLVSEWQAGAISFPEMRAKLVEDEIATEEDVEKAQEEIEQWSNDLVMGAVAKTEAQDERQAVS